MMSETALFSPWSLGPYTLSHRVVMPPLTRMRSGEGNVPGSAAAEYYTQRATPGGLLIAEATQVTEAGQGFPATPGMHSEAQVEAWQKVTAAVHARGGLIFAQLWHVGRVSHRSFQPGGQLPVAPSAIAPPAGQAFTATWERVDFETPRALQTAEIPGIVGAFRNGAANALAAGFDGVEIHAANGYLIEQFLHSRSNHRTDAYGGSVAGRTRLLVEIAEAVSDVWGSERVGARLSPFGVANGSGEEDAFELYASAIAQLASIGLGYLHLIEPRASGMAMADVDHQGVVSASAVFRSHWGAALIAAGGYDGPSAARKVESGEADAIAFGRHFIANPDLPDRIRRGVELNAYDRPTFYGGGAEGYVDYPFHRPDQPVT